MGQVFLLSEFGEIGPANLLQSAFVSESGQQWYELEVGQSCTGKTKISWHGPQNELHRLTRLPDRPSI